MSTNNSNEVCVRCKAYLFPEDDTVYCPDCGAPHHRDCYNALGHCALEEFHGTEQEYSKKTAEKENTDTNESKSESENFYSQNQTKCGMCGEVYDKYLKRCPKCNTPDVSQMAGFGNFDFLGGVPADTDLGDGVTADDAKKFVAANTQRYIPKFAAFSKKKKCSWNWLAFLFASPWMFSRKMYVGGIITGVLSIAANLLMVPFYAQLLNMGIEIVNINIQTANEIIKNFHNLSTGTVICLCVALAISLGISLICGIFGDYFYKNHTISSVKKIKAESNDIAADYRKKGSVNVFYFLLAFMALDYIPSLIVMFLW